MFWSLLIKVSQRKEASAIPSQEEMVENITMTYGVGSTKQLDSFIREY